MGLFSTPEKKWIKEKQNEMWNKVFSGLRESEVMAAKLLVWESACFADNLLSSPAFQGQNLALRVDAMALAKVQFYHAFTMSPVLHNLFYGYVHEMWVSLYKAGDDTARTVVDRMRSVENTYLNEYYAYGERSEGFMPDVMEYFCRRCTKNNTEDGPVLAVSYEELLAATELALGTAIASVLLQSGPLVG